MIVSILSARYSIIPCLLITLLSFFGEEKLKRRLFHSLLANAKNVVALFLNIGSFMNHFYCSTDDDRHILSCSAFRVNSLSGILLIVLSVSFTNKEEISKRRRTLSNNWEQYSQLLVPFLSSSSFLR